MSDKTLSETTWMMRFGRKHTGCSNDGRKHTQAFLLLKLFEWRHRQREMMPFRQQCESKTPDSRARTLVSRSAVGSFHFARSSITRSMQSGFFNSTWKDGRDTALAHLEAQDVADERGTSKRSVRCGSWETSMRPYRRKAPRTSSTDAGPPNTTPKPSRYSTMPCEGESKIS